MMVNVVVVVVVFAVVVVVVVAFGCHKSSLLSPSKSRCRQLTGF